MKGGSADPANTGEITKQDITVATGVITTIVGLLSGLGATTNLDKVAAGVFVANGLDDVGTNKNGESFLQQKVSNPKTKEKIGIAKTVISVSGAAMNTVSGSKSLLNSKAGQKALEKLGVQMSTKVQAPKVELPLTTEQEMVLKVGDTGNTVAGLVNTFNNTDSSNDN